MQNGISGCRKRRDGELKSQKVEESKSIKVDTCGVANRCLNDRTPMPIGLASDLHRSCIGVASDLHRSCSVEFRIHNFLAREAIFSASSRRLTSNPTLIIALMLSYYSIYTSHIVLNRTYPIIWLGDAGCLSVAYPLLCGNSGFWRRCRRNNLL